MDSTFDIVKDLKERIDRFLVTSIGEEIQYYCGLIFPEVSSNILNKVTELQKNNVIYSLNITLISIIKYPYLYL